MTLKPTNENRAVAGLGQAFKAASSVRAKSAGPVAAELPRKQAIDNR
jgi:hypothetical protein